MEKPKFPWGTVVEAIEPAFKNGVFPYDRGKVLGVVVGCTDTRVYVVRRNQITALRYSLSFWKKRTESWG